MAGNQTDEKSPTSHTPWGFASDLLFLLGRLGPTVIVVGGFLFFGYVFYKELTVGRIQAEAQLQERLKFAQQQLVETYEKMGGMSDQLINNINSLLELNADIDADVEVSRKRLDELEEESNKKLQAAKAEATQARRDGEQAQDDFERTNSEFRARQTDIENKLQALEAKRVELVNETSILEVRRKEQETTIANRVRQIDNFKREIAELKRANERLLARVGTGGQGDGDGSDTKADISEQEIETTRERAARNVFEAFAEAPESVGSDDLDILIGLSVKAIKASARKGLGYDLWIALKSEESGEEIIGILRQTERGFGRYIRVDVLDGRVVNIDTRLAYLYLSTPKPEDWYENWLVTTRITEKEATSGYRDYERETLVIYDLEQLFSRKIEILFGIPQVYRVAPITSWQNEFPKQYQDWSSQSDEFGRPSLILRMLERKENFEAAKIPGIAASNISTSLQQTIIDILNAAVRRTGQLVTANLGSDIGLSELGPIAAMALRDDLRVEKVLDETFSDRAGNLHENFSVTMSFQAADGQEERRRSRLQFQRENGEWLLTAFSARL